MVRLKFFVFAVIAVAVAAFAVYAVSSPVAGSDPTAAKDAARHAARSAAGEVTRQQEALVSATLAARTTPEVSAVLESANFARPGLTVAERLERLRVPFFAALPEDARATAKLWLTLEGEHARAELERPAEAVASQTAARAPAEEAPIDAEEVPVEGVPVEEPPPAEVDAASLAEESQEAAPPAEGSEVPSAPGLFQLDQVTYLVTAVELTPARGQLWIGVPLRLQPLDALVAGAPALSLALIEDGKALAASGAISGDALVSLLASAPLDGAGTVKAGTVATVGPLALPLFGVDAAATPLQVGSRHGVHEGLEAGAVYEIASTQTAIAAGQRTGLFAVGGLALLALVWTVLMGGSKKGGSEEASDAEPLRASFSVLPLNSAATAAPKEPEAEPAAPGPDDFQFPPSPKAAEADDAAQALAAGGGWTPSPVPAAAPSFTPAPALAPTPVPVAAAPAPSFAPPPVAEPPKPLDPFGMVSQGSPADSYYGDDNPDATRVAAVPQELLQASANSMPANAGASAVARPLGGVPSVAAPAVDPEEQHFHDVFQDFVATRARCGEPSEGVTYEKFVAKLRKNRDQLVQKYACRTVRFQVYVKEGKAALKATPVKD